MATHANENTDPFQPIGLHAERLVSNLIKPRELSEVPESPVIIGNRSFQRGVEVAEMDVAPIFNQPGLILLATIEVDSLKPTTGSHGPFVRIILLARCFSQIGERVVVPSAVDMVNQSGRPVASAIKPSQARRFIEKAIDPNYPIPMDRMNTASDLANQVASMISILPSEYPGLSIIIEQPFQAFKRKRAAARFVWHLQNNPNKAEERANQDGERNNEKSKPGQRDAIAESVARIKRFERIARGEERLRRKRRD